MGEKHPGPSGVRLTPLGQGRAAAAGGPDSSAGLSELFETLASLTSGLSARQVLERVLHAGRRLVDARYAALGVAGPDGRLAEFIHEGLERDELGAMVEAPQGRGVLGHLMTRTEPLRLADIAASPHAAGFPAAHPPMRTFLGVPIRAGEEVIGSLYLADKPGDAAFTPADEQIVQALAGVAGAAVANARVVEAARRQQDALAALHSISSALLGGAAVDDVLHLMALRAKDLVDADAASVTLVNGNRGELTVRAFAGDVGGPPPGTTFHRAGTVQGQVVASGRTVVTADAAGGAASTGPMGGVVTAGPWMSIPLWSAGRPIGALSLARARGRGRFGEQDRTMMEAFAAQASVALQYGQGQRRVAAVAETLRSALLPAALPEIPGMDLAAHYRPQVADIGGDFYDVFHLEDGTWGIALGDVTGSGPEAATWTALTRHTLQAAAMVDPRPDRVMQILNERLSRFADERRFATAVFGQVRRVEEGAEVSLVRAGHPYPLVARHDGRVEVLRPPGRLLGLGDGVEYGVVTTVLGPGDALVLYTDGVTEARAGQDQFGTARLVETVRAAAGSSARELVDAIDAAVCDHADAPIDDVAVVVLSVPPATARTSLAEAVSTSVPLLLSPALFAGAFAGPA